MSKAVRNSNQDSRLGGVGGVLDCGCRGKEEGKEIGQVQTLRRSLRGSGTYKMKISVFLHG